MKTLIDERLREEALRFAFRFACEDCAHVDHPTAAPPRGCQNVTHTTLRCSLGYPATPRREALGEAALELCKAFELGSP